MSIEDRKIIDENLKALDLFIRGYLGRAGIRLRFIIVMSASGSFGPHAPMIYDEAMCDVTNVRPVKGTVTVDADSVIRGAASLDTLVRYASKVSPDVLPAEVVPPLAIVKAALRLLHEDILATTA